MARRTREPVAGARASWASQLRDAQRGHGGRRHRLRHDRGLPPRHAPFNEDEGAWLKIFADQAAVAVRNAPVQRDPRRAGAPDRRAAALQIISGLDGGRARLVFDTIMQSRSRDPFGVSDAGVGVIGEDGLARPEAHIGETEESARVVGSHYRCRCASPCVGWRWCTGARRVRLSRRAGQPGGARWVCAQIARNSGRDYACLWCPCCGRSRHRRHPRPALNRERRAGGVHAARGGDVADLRRPGRHRDPEWCACSTRPARSSGARGAATARMVMTGGAGLPDAIIESDGCA